MLNRLLKSSLAIVMVVLISTPARAGIIVDITSAGAGFTNWTFSGSGTVGGGTVTIDNDNGAVSWGWDIGSAFYSGSNTNADFTSTTASFVSGGTTYTIEGVGAEFNSPSDVFGLAIESATSPAGSYSFGVGSVLSGFTGTGLLAIDISEFALGTTIATNLMNDLNTAVAGTLEIQFNVGTVPEPGILSLMAISLLGFGLIRRSQTATA